MTDFWRLVYHIKHELYLGILKFSTLKFSDKTADILIFKVTDPDFLGHGSIKTNIQLSQEKEQRTGVEQAAPVAGGWEEGPGRHLQFSSPSEFLSVLCDVTSAIERLLDLS